MQTEALVGNQGGGEACMKTIFPDFSKIIFSQTFPDLTNSPTLSSFPWPVGTLWITV